MQKPQEAAETKPAAAEAPLSDWHKPVATFVEASSAENAPGSTPDAGVDYS